VKRGEVWTAAGAKHYIGKPRPVVIVQDDRFQTKQSVTVCAFTTDETDASIFRIRIAPSSENGLRTASIAMADKISTVPRHKLGRPIGRLAEPDMTRLNQAIMIFLGVSSGSGRLSAP
jgi:mRNA interferase MazF